MLTLMAAVKRMKRSHFWWRATCALVSIIFVTFEAAFVTKDPVLIVLSYILDAILLTDTFLTARTEWAARHNTKPTKAHIAWHASVMIGDLPIEVLVMCFGVKWEIIARLRLNRLLRWLKVKSLYKEHHADMNNWNFSTICFNLAIMILMTVHFTACIWFVVICPDPLNCRTSE